MAYGPRMPGPPLPMKTVVRLDAHSLARALMMRVGTPVMGDAHSGVLGYAVFPAHDVVLELVHAVGVGLEVLLVVGAVLEPLWAMAR